MSYLDHMAHDIQPSSVIESIASEARTVIEGVYPDAAREEAEEPGGSGERAVEGSDEGLTLTWSGAAGELGHACQAMPQVRRHLLAMVASLLSDAGGPRQPALRRAHAKLGSERSTEATA